MNKIFIDGPILALALFSGIAHCVEPRDQRPAVEKNGPTGLDRWNEARRQAAIAVGLIKDPSSARRVRRYAKPEIIIKDSNIFFDGKNLEFGRPLTFWKDIIKREPRCDKTGTKWCVWEDLGLEASSNQKSNFGVSAVNIKISIPGNFADQTSNNKSKAEWLAHHAFAGYLEIDGFGIDKDTQFWELESNVDIRRNLTCGLRSCEFPRGIFGPDKMIALHLNGESKSATIEEVTLYATFD